MLRQYVHVLLRNRGDPSPRPFGHFPAPPAMLGAANGAGYPRIRASLHCFDPIVRPRRNLTRKQEPRAVASAAGCRPNGAPCGAASGRRKSPKGGAQDARQFAACTRTCIQRTPQPAREPGGQDARKARYLGCVSFGYLSLHKQRKVTRSPEGRVKASHFKEQGAGFRLSPE